MPPKRIDVVASFHYDVAYLQTYSDYLPTVFNNIDEALRLLEAHDDYRFLLEQVIVLEAYWQRFPEKRKLLRRFVREGRLEVAPGMYVMPDMNLPGGESLFRQIELGRKWLKAQLDYEPRVSWIADCWGHHAQLPQILRQAGYDYYVFWRCMRRDVQKNDFVWQGLDGSTIRTHWLARSYSNLRFPDQAEIANVLDLGLYGCGPEEIRALCEELEAYGPSERLLLCNGGDFARPQASGPDALAALSLEEDLPPIGFATADEFLKKVAWEDKPLVTGEFNSSMQGTYTSNIRIKQLNHTLSNRLLALEALAVVLEKPLDVEPIWQLVLKQQFHDILCGTITDAALEDCYREFAEAGKLMDDALGTLEDGGATPVFFNPLPFQRTEFIEEGEASFLLELPPLGVTPKSKAKRLEAVPASSLPLSFTNPFYSARIGREGYLTSLIPTGGQELVREGYPAFGALAMQMDYGDLWLEFEAPLSGGSLESSLTQNHPDPFSRAEPGSLVNRETLTATVERAEVVRASGGELVIEQQGHFAFWRLRLPFRTRLRLAQHSPRIEFETSIEPSGKHYRLRAAFPTTMTAGERLDEIPFGVMRREVGEHPVQNWLDYGSEDLGLSLLNRGTPGHSVDNGILLMSLFRSVAMEYKAPSAGSFNEGVPHTFHYALLPRGRRELAVIIREGQAFANPPLPGRFTALEGAWELTGDAFMASLRTFGDHLLLRLYEGTGQGAAGGLTLPPSITAYALADGLGKPTGDWTTCSGELAFDLKPFAIQAYLLRRQP